MIFVDTSVWVAYLRGSTQPLVNEFRRLLDEDAVALTAVGRLEILGGTSSVTLPRLRRVLAAIPTFYPSPDTWSLIERWVVRAVMAGQRFGAADLLIAALAAERGASVWSLDSDFQRMATLRLVKLHRPRI